MSVAKMQSALVEAFMASSPALPAIYPNTKTDVKDSPLWVKVDFSWNDPVAITSGSDGEDEVVGFMQLGVTGRTGEGEGAIMAKVKPLLEKFTTGEKFLYDGQEVMVTSAGKGSGYKVDSWWRIPVTVNFLGRYQRNTPT